MMNWERSDKPDADGATAPETLRHPGPFHQDNLERGMSAFDMSTEGDGASCGAQMAAQALR